MDKINSFSEDAYLCSLRANSMLDPPPPRALLKQQQRQQRAINENNNKNGSIIIAPSPSKVTSSSSSEQYTSPLLQRCKERSMERISFIQEYEATHPMASRLRKDKNDKNDKSDDDGAHEATTMTTTSGPSKQGDKNEKDGEKKLEVEIGTTKRTKKLWDLSLPAPETRDDDDDYNNDYNNDFDYDPASSSTPISEYHSHGTFRHNKRDGETNPDVKAKKTAALAAVDSPVWDAARIRRELRSDIAKKAKSDLNEMEEFAAGMRERIQRYSSVLIKKEDDAARMGQDDQHADEKTSDNKATRSAARAGAGRESDAANARKGECSDNMGMKSNENKFNTPTKSKKPSATGNDQGRTKENPYEINLATGEVQKKTTRDNDGENDDDEDSDGYGKPVRSSNKKKKAKDEDEHNNDQDRRPTTKQSNKEQAGKYASSYRGIHMEDDDDSQGSEEYFATSSGTNNNSKGKRNDCDINQLSCDSQDSEEYVATSDNHNNNSTNANKISGDSPRDARFQRIKDLKKKQLNDHRQKAYLPPPPPPPEEEPPAKEETPTKVKEMAERVAYKTGKTDLDEWWADHKKQQQKLKESSDERLENWWKDHRARREAGQNRGTKERPVIDELSGEPVEMDDDKAAGELDGKPAVVDGDVETREEAPASSLPSDKPPLSPSSKSPKTTKPLPAKLASPRTIRKESTHALQLSSPRTTRKENSAHALSLSSPRTTRKESSVNALSPSSRIELIRSRHAKDADRSNVANSTKSRQRQAPPVPESPRGRNAHSKETANDNENKRTTDTAAPPVPESPRARNAHAKEFANDDNNNRHTAADPPLPDPSPSSRQHRTPTKTNTTTTTTRNIIEEARSLASPHKPPSSYVINYNSQDTLSAAASVLSDDVPTDNESRCLSVAQSTLVVLLSRIEEANANFATALVDGDVEKQTELAGLMTRLGEAAVTMRKLERL